MKFKKIFWIILGCISVGFGAVGTVLPFLPTVPFLLLATFCFAKSSKKLHDRFTNSKLYKKNLESYVNGKGMTVKAKIRIMSAVTLLMAFGFTVMMIKDVYIPSLILGIIWILHILYFIFGIKTLK